MKSPYKVAIVCSGERRVHATSTNGNCATLCGMDGDDPHPDVAQRGDVVKPGEKIDCPQCYAIWATAKQYKLSDFTREVAAEIHV